MHKSHIANAKKLVWHVITEVRWMTPEEVKDFGWSFASPVLILDNGTFIVAQSDDEGNEAGAMSTENFTLPVDRPSYK